MNLPITTAVGLVLCGLLLGSKASELNATAIGNSVYGGAIALGVMTVNDRPVVVCISCIADHDPANAPDPSTPFWIEFASEQCEDGFSASGPCIKCQVSSSWDCGDLSTWAAADACELTDKCSVSELYEVADNLFQENDISAFEALVALHPSYFRRDDSGRVIQAVDCQGSVVSTFTLPNPLFSGRK